MCCTKDILLDGSEWGKPGRVEETCMIPAEAFASFIFASIGKCF